jgi:hypothetical protein
MLLLALVRAPKSGGALIEGDRKAPARWLLPLLLLREQS